MLKWPHMLRINDWPLTAKLMVVIVLTALIPTLIVGFMGLNRNIEGLRKDAFAAKRTQTLEAAQKVEMFFRDLKADAIFVANSSPMHQLLDVTQGLTTKQVLDLIKTGANQELTRARERMAQEMIAFMDMNDYYFKVRFIDTNGQEIVEVSKKSDQYKVSPFAKLQDESKDDAVIGGLVLPAGKVFTGRFKLETQGGKIVTPHTPALRFSTPIYYQDQVRGVVVTNVALGRLLLPSLQTKNLIAVDVNQDGMYLEHPEASKIFGVDLKTGESFRKDYPDIADEVFRRTQGIIEREDDTFLAFYTAEPVPDTDRHWKIVSINDMSEVMAPVERFRQAFVLTLIAVLAVAILLAYLSSKLLTRQVKHISDLIARISVGNFKARTAVVSNDELGQMARSFNHMLDNTSSLVQFQKQEYDATQTAIMKLLDEVSDVATGNLTVEAEVTEDVTGAIADSFNDMIYQLRTIITNVQDATLQVTSSASEIQTAAEHLAEGSTAQAAQIIESSDVLDDMAVSIRQVAEKATASATVAEQALANAKQGTTAVQKAIQAMHRMRDKMQETATRIKSLGEHSQEIGEIVQLIGDIADRTSVLALNASIEAALAGETGQGFSVVAREVEQLAERSMNATRQIADLVNTIQIETTKAVTAMEESTHEAMQGSQVADQAGQALGEIEGVSTQLAELTQSISLAAAQQARDSENLSKAMGEISGVTQQTAAGTKQAAVSISTLATLADELRDSVSTFKLPTTTNGHSRDV
jgi:methyl-accepting chemotaxis protein